MANSPARSSIDVGSIIAGTYTIEALIGRGGMGAVFLASHQRLPGKKVAIKLLHTELRDDEVLARFKREAQITSQLDHPNIVGVHDSNVMEDGTPYLVLEYLAGESLASRLRQGPVPVDGIASIVRQVGSALTAAHRAGIVHRDLKPANIFLVPSEVDGRAIEVAKILDFGISKMLGSTTVKTQDSTLLGTPAYMAPEQAKGDHANVDARTDVFALGVIVYEMLAGHPPFAGASIPEVVFKVVYEAPLPLAQQAPNAPLAMVAAVERAMAKARTDRFESVSAFVEALTGTPLTLNKSPVPPVFIRDDAFAQTLGSGDHGSSPPTPVPPPATPVSKQTPTVMSNAEIVVPPPTAPAARRRWPLVAALVGVVGVGAAVGLLATRSGGKKPHVDAVDATLVAEVFDAPVAEVHDAAQVVVVVHDAAAVVHDAAPVAVVHDAAVKRPPPPQEPDEPDDPGSTVAQADSALRAGNYKLAERLASSIINGSAPAAPKQLARAHAIRGSVFCLRDADLGKARGELDQIAGRFPRMRALIASSCKGVGSL